MEKQQGVLGIFPGFAIFILGVGLMNHVVVLPPLLRAAGRDAWISVLMAILPYFAWILLIYVFNKLTGQQYIFTWLQNAYGTWVNVTFKVLFIIYAFAVFTTTQQETIMWTHTSYLPRTPHMILSLALMLFCYRCAYHGLRTIAITTGILLPLVVFFGDFVMSANMLQKNYSLLMPILENGWLPPVKGMILLLGGLAELTFIVVIQHTFKKKTYAEVLLGTGPLPCHPGARAGHRRHCGVWPRRSCETQVSGIRAMAPRRNREIHPPS